MLAIRPYSVKVNGFPAYTFFAASPGKARAEAWRSYGNYSSATTFGEFLKISRVTRAAAPSEFGREVIVAGRPAYLVALSTHGNNHHFVRPDSDTVMLAHEADFVGLPDRGR